MHLLWIEDNLAFLNTVYAAFLSEHLLTIASTVAEARLALEHGTFDAILLDYDLPDGKGIELMPELVARGLNSRVIATSSLTENNARLLHAGAAAAVRKADFGRIEEVLQRLEPNPSL